MILVVVLIGFIITVLAPAVEGANLRFGFGIEIGDMQGWSSAHDVPELSERGDDFQLRRARQAHEMKLNFRFS